MVSENYIIIVDLGNSFDISFSRLIITIVGQTLRKS